jgi:hypothetical protein
VLKEGGTGKKDCPFKIQVIYWKALVPFTHVTYHTDALMFTGVALFVNKCMTIADAAAVTAARS